MGLPSRSRRSGGPWRSAPLAFAAAAGVQSAGRPEEHSPQRPQLGTNARTTWSPARTSRDAGADLLDDARRLVAERHRERADARAVHHGEVGVADAPRLDADEQLPGARREQLDLLELQRARVGVGAAVGDGAQHGGDGLHTLLLPASGATRGRHLAAIDVEDDVESACSSERGRTPRGSRTCPRRAGATPPGRAGPPAPARRPRTARRAAGASCRSSARARGRRASAGRPRAAAPCARAAPRSPGSSGGCGRAAPPRRGLRTPRPAGARSPRP